MDEIVPLSGIKGSPVIKDAESLGHLSPNVVKVKVEVNFSIFILNDGLLESVPVRVVAEGESNSDDAVVDWLRLLFLNLFLRLRNDFNFILFWLRNAQIFFFRKIGRDTASHIFGDEGTSNFE